MSIRAAIEKHAVAVYFALAFTISWGGLIGVLGAGAFTGAALAPDAPVLFLFAAMLAGPSIAGLLMTGLVHGRAGFRELLARLLTWRIGAGWYAIAIVTAPLFVLAILLTLSLFSPAFMPAIFTSGDRGSLLLFGIIAGLVTGLGEELGWTGFAVPALRRRHGVVATGVIVGVLWGAWHFPLFAGGDPSGVVPMALLLPVQLFTFLVAFRVLLVWIYDRTDSLPVTMLMHASLTTTTLVLQSVDPGGTTILIADVLLAVALWAMVTVISQRAQPAPPPTTGQSTPFRRRLARARARGSGGRQAPGPC